MRLFRFPATTRGARRACAFACATMIVTIAASLRPALAEDAAPLAAAAVEAAAPPTTLPLDPPEAETQLAAASLGPVVLDGGLTVEVTGDQRITVVGSNPSMRAVIQEVCRQAGVQLRTYDAPDRRAVGRLAGVELTDALRSLLRAESYLVGFRSDARGRQRVTWLRVFGGVEGGSPVAPAVAAALAQPQPAPAQAGANAPAAAPEAPDGQGFVVSASLLFQAFGTFDPQRRDQAQRELLTRMASPAEMSRFLSQPTGELAATFGRYRGSADTIRRMHSLADRPEVAAKLNEVLMEVEKIDPQLAR
jgi:hypothetical protein